jgi:hypothetical protein
LNFSRNQSSFGAHVTARKDVHLNFLLAMKKEEKSIKSNSKLNNINRIIEWAED